MFSRDALSSRTVRRQSLVAGVVLTAALVTLVALPGAAGSQTPTPARPLTAEAFQMVRLPASDGSSPAANRQLDAGYESAGHLDDTAPLIEPGAIRCRPIVRRWLSLPRNAGRAAALEAGVAARRRRPRPSKRRCKARCEAPLAQPKPVREAVGRESRSASRRASPAQPASRNRCYRRVLTGLASWYTRPHDGDAPAHAAPTFASAARPDCVNRVVTRLGTRCVATSASHRRPDARRTSRRSPAVAGRRSWRRSRSTSTDGTPPVVEGGDGGLIGRPGGAPPGSLVTQPFNDRPCEAGKEERRVPHRGDGRVSGRQIMTAEEIRRATTRISHEIVEKQAGTTGLVLVGIQRRGVPSRAGSPSRSPSMTASRCPWVRSTSRSTGTISRWSRSSRSSRGRTCPFDLNEVHDRPRGRRPLHRSHDSRRHGRARGFRASARHPSRGPRGSRPPRAADPRRPRRQERAHVARGDRAGAPCRGGRRGRRGRSSAASPRAVASDDAGVSVRRRRPGGRPKPRRLDAGARAPGPATQTIPNRRFRRHRGATATCWTSTI